MNCGLDGDFFFSPMVSVLGVRGGGEDGFQGERGKLKGSKWLLHVF